jgi:hypothetical protein
MPLCADALMHGWHNLTPPYTICTRRHTRFGPHFTQHATRHTSHGTRHDMWHAPRVTFRIRFCVTLSVAQPCEEMHVGSLPTFQQIRGDRWGSSSGGRATRKHSAQGASARGYVACALFTCFTRAFACICECFLCAFDVRWQPLEPAFLMAACRTRVS